MQNFFFVVFPSGENLVQEYDEVRLQMRHIVTKWNICR